MSLREENYFEYYTEINAENYVSTEEHLLQELKKVKKRVDKLEGAEDIRKDLDRLSA